MNQQACDDPLLVQTANSIRETIHEFRTGCTEFEQQIERLFSDLERMHAEMLRRSRQIAKQREVLDMRESERNVELRRRLTEIHDERDTLRQQLDSAVDELSEIRD